MHFLYTEQDLARLKGQLKRRYAVFLAIFLVAAVLTGLTLIMDDRKQNRPEVQTTLAVILGGSAMIFYWDMMIHPLSAYTRHVDTALHGRSHEITVTFDHLNEEESVVEAITYRDIIFLGEADRHGIREQMFYWDVEFPLPAFTPGQEVTLRYFDRYITGYSA